MYVILKCMCPKYHKITIKHKLVSGSVDATLVNKELVDTKIYNYCNQCKESTVLLVQDITSVSEQKKDEKLAARRKALIDGFLQS